MSFYAPRPMPAGDDVASLKKWMQQEVLSLQRALSEANDRVRFNYLHKAPDKFQAGDTVLADGVDWNPTGAGVGKYRRNETNTLWVFEG